MEKFIHQETVYNLQSPKEIVPELMKLLKPNSVVDFGCGLGTFLHVFKGMGVAKVLGLDGSWVDREKLTAYIEAKEFKEWDLETPVHLKERYDLVLSVEVAEHLKRDAADIFVQNLVNAGKIIVFSAAIPMQGGQGHVNEEWLNYWEEKFAAHDYVLHDVLRPIFWNNPKVFWWYKQNMVLFAPTDVKFNWDISSVPSNMRKLVHPDLFLLRAQSLNDLKKGNMPSSKYLRLLIKSFTRFSPRK